MKILYVKNNSERAKEFQLKTIIYEDNGQKYVKKEALTKEALPHLKRMKENYEKLTNSIINPKIKLAKIIDESENSLTFEFIEGVSLENKLHEALKSGEDQVREVIGDYITLISNGFRTTQFNHKMMISDTYQTLFGKIDFSKMDDALCFENISNFDLIFSNIIFKEDNVYLIDYEWIYETPLPIAYIIYRTILTEPPIPKIIKDEFTSNEFNYLKMERHFIDKYVMTNGFYFYKKNYIKVNYSIMHHLQEKDSYINRLSERIYELDNQVQHTGDELHYARSIVEQRDQQLKGSISLYRIKNLIKKFFLKK